MCLCFKFELFYGFIASRGIPRKNEKKDMFSIFGDSTRKRALQEYPKSGKEKPAIQMLN